MNNEHWRNISSAWVMHDEEDFCLSRSASIPRKKVPNKSRKPRCWGPEHFLHELLQLRTHMLTEWRIWRTECRREHSKYLGRVDWRVSNIFMDKKFIRAVEERETHEVNFHPKPWVLWSFSRVAHALTRWRRYFSSDFSRIFSKNEFGLGTRSLSQYDFVSSVLPVRDSDRSSREQPLNIVIVVKYCILHRAEPKLSAKRGHSQSNKPTQRRNHSFYTLILFAASASSRSPSLSSNS